MSDSNQDFIRSLDVNDVPWHRLTTAYGRATYIPKSLQVLDEMADSKSVLSAVDKITQNIEHQGTFWHATPFAMVFLCRILCKALDKAKQDPIALKLADHLITFFETVVDCCLESNEMDHAKELPCFKDMLQEQYLWSEDGNDEDDELRYEEDEVFPDDLFYSFYYYSYQVLLTYKDEICAHNVPELSDSIEYLKDNLQ